MNELSIIEDGSIWIEEGIIKAVGTTQELEEQFKAAPMKRKSQTQRAISLHRDLSIHIHMSHMAAVVNVNLKCDLKVRPIWKL